MIKNARSLNPISGKANVWVVGGLSILALMAIGGVILFFIVKGAADDYVDTYTSTEMSVFPTPTMTAEEAQPLIDDFNAFKTAIDNGEAPDAFSLTGDEINILLQYDETLDALAGMAHVDIEEDRIYADVSVPLGMITDMLEGQYLNGSGLIQINMQEDELYLSLDQLEVKGVAVPEGIMNEIRTVNQADEIQDNPDARRLLKQIASITVEDGRLVIIPKPLEE
jgi:hypothetical protein